MSSECKGSVQDSTFLILMNIIVLAYIESFDCVDLILFANFEILRGFAFCRFFQNFWKNPQFCNFFIFSKISISIFGKTRNFPIFSFFKIFNFCKNTAILQFFHFFKIFNFWGFWVFIFFVFGVFAFCLNFYVAFCKGK